MTAREPLNERAPGGAESQAAGHRAIQARIESPTDPGVPPRLRFWHGFWLPVTHMFRPWTLGAQILDSPVHALAYSILIGLGFLGLVLTSLVVLDYAEPLRSYSRSLEAHLFGFRREDALAALFGAPLGFIGVSLILAVLRFPGLHRSGSPWQTLLRGVKSSLAMVWLASLLVTVGYFVVTGVDSALREIVRPPHRDDAEGILAFAGVSCLFWGLVGWVRQLDEGMVSRHHAVDLPKVCEGCGYLLMGEQAETVCSECGRAAADSLLPGRARRTPEWEDRPSFSNWLKAIGSCLLAPTKAYGSMPMRGGMRASGRLLISTFLAIGIGAYAWFFAVYCMDVLFRRPATPGRFDWVEALAIPIVPGCVCPLVGWLWHRGIGAVVALAVAWQAPLRDGRWLLKLLNYECCYLSLHCVLNGTLLTVFILAQMRFEAVMQAITGVRGISGIPWGVVIVFLGNLALGAIWFARYGRLVRAIRWNNF